jgi:PAS domain S-box-containing protein
MLKKFQTRRGREETKAAEVVSSDEPVLLGRGQGALQFKIGGWAKWKPMWFEHSNDSLLIFNKRGAGKPAHVVKLMAAILKSADELLGEEFSFALFVPQKEPHYFKASNQEQKSMWMGLLNKHCASTEWSTSSMVTAFLDPVVVASQDANIVEVNDAFLHLFGYERAQVIGKNLKMLMPGSIGQHHDGYIKAYLDTGVAKLVGKPRAVIGQHADGSPLPVVLSLGVENGANGKKTFIATLRTDKEKKNVPSKVELDALMHKAVDNTLQEATIKIKEALSGELEQIMKRLEDYQASYKLLAAKGLKGKNMESASSIDDHDSESEHRHTSKPGRAEMTIDTSNIAVGHRLGLGGSGCAVYSCNVDGWECAMKELKVANAKQSDIDAFSAEVFLLESLPPHKNLVRFLFHQKTSDRIRVFMRRYEGTLDVYLRARKEKDEYLDVSDVARLSLDVVRALEILHDYKIIHRDVSTEARFPFSRLISSLGQVAEPLCQSRHGGQRVALDAVGL